jgi:DNA-binding NtrC family response regulator
MGRQWVGCAKGPPVTAEVESSARAVLSGVAFDAALLDYDLDDGKGDALLEWLSSRASASAVIAIFSHDAGNEALMKAGAVAVCSKLHFEGIGDVLRDSH